MLRWEPRSLGTWPCLEMGPLQRESSPGEVVRAALTQNDWCPCKRGRFGHRPREKPREDRGRDWGQASTAGTGVAGSTQSGGGESGNYGVGHLGLGPLVYGPCLPPQTLVLQSPVTSWIPVPGGREHLSSLPFSTTCSQHPFLGLWRL